MLSQQGDSKVVVTLPSHHAVTLQYIYNQSFMPNQVTDDSILFIFQFICREYMTPKK
ncbi:hypothetical protein BN890_47080 [Bacteroides xylanisolvens SD CC 1b]|uniref:Uncharacterized protein n=1 Tax=Bacteroides xylanisolvens SD CC 1b TaxID=702447 RepID=W6PAJ9_9BACE|nr:hypothetical protein BN891_13220 [Bacteroides xylanisolvens SD CC 2a]CDM07086.1 hypothetical protein BN890_47080 [Bacteroides xylanisolvens SD CC 1b]